jgi:hypothetical protein
MSGFVSTRFAFFRISGRSALGVSPSYADARICVSFKARTARSWSRASAFVGNRYRAVAFGTATAASANATSYTSVLPLAVPVARITSLPDRSASSPRD